MQTRTYTGTFRVGLLHEELDSIPGMKDSWAGSYLDGTLTLSFPDTVSAAAVDLIVSSHNPDGSTADEAARSQIIQMAQSAVGVRLQDLTAAQVKALLAVILYKAGAVDPAALTIRPLRDWAG